jgi:hypothetical protein
MRSFATRQRRSLDIRKIQCFLMAGKGKPFEPYERERRRSACRYTYILTNQYWRCCPALASMPAFSSNFMEIVKVTLRSLLHPTCKRTDDIQPKFPLWYDCLDQKNPPNSQSFPLGQMSIPVQQFILFLLPCLARRRWWILYSQWTWKDRQWRWRSCSCRRLGFP